MLFKEIGILNKIINTFPISESISPLPFLNNQKINNETKIIRKQNSLPNNYPASKKDGNITLVDVLQNWLNWFHFLFLEGGLLVILIDCMIFR